MANEVLVKNGVEVLFSDATDFPNSGSGPPTTGANNLITNSPVSAAIVQMDLTALASGGGSRESAKADLQAATWASRWTVNACLEFGGSPTDGGTVDFYWGPSPQSVAGTGNVGGLTGSDASFTDTTGNLGQMQYIGSLTVRNAAVNIGQVGVFSPVFRYGRILIRI
jgi:hypothetical protein